MFCKCYFASIWEQLQALGTGSAATQQHGAIASVTSSVKLRPVYLPAISYLVASDDGWFASVHARFVQARRHSQGLAELSYLFLQHAHVLLSGRAKGLAWSAHTRILGMAGKMASVHMIANLHSLALVIASVLMVLETIRWLLAGNAQELLQTLATRGLQGVLSLQSLGGLTWALCAIFGPIPPMGMMMTATTYLVVKDTLEGTLTRDAAAPKRKAAADEPIAPDVEGCAKGPNGLGWWGQLRLFLLIQSDYFNGAAITIILYGLAPVTLAAWSLLSKNGAGFQYVVGAKPTDAA